MPRLARLILAALLASITASAQPDHTLDAQEQASSQLHISIQLEPRGASSAFAGGLIDMRFTGSERHWNTGAGTAEVAALIETLPRGPVSMLGNLSWSTADAELPLPPTDVTLSMFAASGEPYRVMASTTDETLFTVLSISSEGATMEVRGSIQLHVSTGTLLLIDEPVQVRGAASYSRDYAAR
jgi:hypothetical protein